MNTFQFITSISWVLLGLIVVSIAAYLVFSGRLRWVEYQSVVGKIGLQVATNLGVKDLSPDEILAFESFVYRDLGDMERGSRLAYILLFKERGLLNAEFEDNTLYIELTEKGKQLHAAIIAECEKQLMISPKTDIKWRTGERKMLAKAEKSQVKNHKPVEV